MLVVILPLVLQLPVLSTGDAAGNTYASPYSSCSATFHVWQAGEDTRDTIKDLYLKVDNLTAYANLQLAETKVQILSELGRLQNWTHEVDRRVFQIQAERMDDELVQMKFSSSTAKVKMQLDFLSRRVDKLDESLHMVKGKFVSESASSGSQRENAAWMAYKELPQMQGFPGDVTKRMRNSISDLKAEWIILKRDVEFLKRGTQNLITAHSEVSNDTISLKNVLSRTDITTKHLDRRVQVLSDRQNELRNSVGKATNETISLWDHLDRFRRAMLQNGEKIAGVQVKLNSVESRLRSVERSMFKGYHPPKPSAELTDPRAMSSDVRTTSATFGDTTERNRPSYSSMTGGDTFPRDCHEVYQRGHHVSAVYNIYVDGARYLMPVYCEMINNTGYTLLQRRVDGSINFNRGWSEYKQGFGNQYGEMWAGNEFIHLLSSQKKYVLRVDFWDWDGEQYFAEYSRFYVDDETERYRLQVGGFTGSAGDSLSYHNRMAFSTEDMDNDLNENHCAADNKGGWWYNKCFYSQLNGLYRTAWYSRQRFADGIVWFTLKNDKFYSLRRVEMKVRPQFRF